MTNGVYTLPLLRELSLVMTKYYAHLVAWRKPLRCDCSSIPIFRARDVSGEGTKNLVFTLASCVNWGQKGARRRGCLSRGMQPFATGARLRFVVRIVSVGRALPPRVGCSSVVCARAAPGVRRDGVPRQTGAPACRSSSALSLLG